MAFSDFTLQLVVDRFGVVARPGPIFAAVTPAPVPDWLHNLLGRTLQLPLVSEKARSELIVMPILLACRELSGNTVAIFSGSRLDVVIDDRRYYLDNVAAVLGVFRAIVGTGP